MASRYSCAALLLSLLLGSTSGVVAQSSRSDAKQPQVLRVAPTKPAATRLSPAAGEVRVIVKLREGLTATTRSGQILGLSGSDISEVSNVLQTSRGGALANLFSRPRAELSLEKERGELASGRQLADLSLYFVITYSNATPHAEIEQTIDGLNALSEVEIAYQAPEAQIARVDIAPTTPSYELQQGYLNAAPQGIDSRYAWTFDGGDGSGTRFIDIEGSWQISHEDLKDPFYSGGSFLVDPAWNDHGTAVLGQLIGQPNGYGVTGMTPQASFGVHSIYPSGDVANGINTAAAQLSPGDALLIELQSYSPVVTGESVCNCAAGACPYVPVEAFQAEFDAIAAATANGIVVVEAAGNGNSNLDLPAYGGIFDRTVRDSGAILVGAGSSLGRQPLCFTNYGSRVDVQGWGQSVTTTGYGSLFNADADQKYTSTFSGTSSASPIATGATLSIQGIQKQRTTKGLAPSEVRAILRTHGTAQAAHAKQIGPLPNLKASLDWMLAAADGLLSNSDVMVYNCDAELDAWTSVTGTVKSGTPLSSPSVRRVLGPCALRMGGAAAYVTKTSATNASSRSTRFYYFPESAPASAVGVFSATDASGNVKYSVAHSPTGHLTLQGTGGVALGQLPIAAGVWSSVEVRWSAGTTNNIRMVIGTYASSGTGGSVSDASVVASTGTSSDRVRNVRLGHVSGGASHVSHFDNYASHDSVLAVPRAECRCDANDDGVVNLFDTVGITNDTVYNRLAWGSPDCNLDGVVDVFDRTTSVALRLYTPGTCPTP